MAKSKEELIDMMQKDGEKCGCNCESCKGCKGHQHEEKK